MEVLTGEEALERVAMNPGDMRREMDSARRRLPESADPLPRKCSHVA